MKDLVENVPNKYPVSLVFGVLVLPELLGWAGSTWVSAMAGWCAVSSSCVGAGVAESDTGGSGLELAGGLGVVFVWSSVVGGLVSSWLISLLLV